MIEARTVQPDDPVDQNDCAGCNGSKQAPLASIVSIYHEPAGLGFTIALCEECGRDLANAVGFTCIRDGGWSKLEPRKRKAVR